MAKTKSDPSRRSKLTNFKEQQKAKNKKQRMSNEAANIPDLPKINQRPYWNSQEDITIKGFEFEAMVNAINIFREGVTAVESSLQRNIQTGKVKMKYFDEDGTELTPEQVEVVTKQYAEYFNAVAAQRQAIDQKSSEPIKKLILDEAGSPISSEDKVSVKPILTAV